MALFGVLEEAVRVLPVMVLLSLPVPVVVTPVEKKMVPTVVVGLEPLMVQFWMVLFVASPIKRMVLELANVLVFSIINASPAVFRPLMFTLSAPLKLINGVPPTAPEMVRVPPPDGERVILAHAPAFNEVVPNSAVISPVIDTTILLLVCAVPLIAENKPPALVSEV